MSVNTEAFKQLSLSCFLGENSIQKKGENVWNLVKSYKSVIEVALETLDRLHEGRVPDPTVGENACQLRAVIYTGILNAEDFEQTLQTAQSVLRSALENLKKAALPGKHEFISLDAFLTINQADAPIDQRIHWFILGRILEKTRKPDRGFSLDAQGQVEYLEKIVAIDGFKGAGFSPTAIRNLESYAKKALSHHSVAIVQGWALDLPDKEESQRLYALVSGDKVKTTNQKLATAPCFSSAQVCFDLVCRERTPFILRVKQINAETAGTEGIEAFFFASNGISYERTKEENVLKRRAAILIDAASIASPILTRKQLKHELDQREIRETLLAFLATHPVYGGGCKKEPGPIEEAAVRQPYAEKARQWECCPENPRVCRLYHIYAVSTAQWKEVI